MMEWFDASPAHGRCRHLRRDRGVCAQHRVADWRFDAVARHPDLADGALLVACGCDPEAWRSRMRAQQPGPRWDEPNPSVLPLSTVAQVRAGTMVRLIVGAADTVTPVEYSRNYAEALRRRGIDARLTIEPGLGHNMLVTPPAFRELGTLVRELTSRITAR
jgi:fermentation-respiration switch protein FrsA (DUF1100 family)